MRNRPLGRGAIGKFLSLPLLLLLLLGGPLASAQNYDSKPIEESARLLRYKAQQFAKFRQGESADFTRYMTRYVLPKLADPSPQGLGELAKTRYELFRDFVYPSEPQIQQQLTRVLLLEMGKLAQNEGGNFHPSVRYNAAIVLGMLDATYADDRTRTPAVPLPAANELLTKLAQQGNAGGDIPATLVIGALVGLERHASLLGSLPPANRAATVAALQAIATNDDLSLDVANSVKLHVRYMACRALAATQNLGDGNKNHSAIFSLITHEDMKLNNRARSAELLRSFRTAYGQASDLDQRRITRDLLQLASDIAADENQRALDYERRSLRGGGGGAGLNYDINLPDEYQVRRIVLRMRALTAALEAVKPAIKDAELAQALEGVSQSIHKVRNIAEDKNVIELNLAAAMKTMARDVEAIAGRIGVEAAEPTELEEGEGELDEEGEAEAPAENAAPPAAAEPAPEPDF